MIVAIAVAGFGTGAYVTYATGSAYAGILIGTIAGVAVMIGWLKFIDR